MVNPKIFENKKDIVCIYHNSDYDGIGSAEIVRYYFSNYAKNSSNIKFIGLNYGIEIPYKTLKNKIIICCDFTPDNFKIIIKDSYHTIWIDHHISSIELMKDFKADNFENITNIDYAACLGVWKYFISEDKIPRAIELLSKFDSHTFTKAEEDDCINFQYGMKALGKQSELDGDIWCDLFNNAYSKNANVILNILDQGEIVNRFMTEHYDIAVCNRTARTTILNVPELNKTYKVLFLNMPYGFSDSFKAFYNKKEHDILMSGYLASNNKWAYSFYCPADKNIDVSKIAKTFGGGGHKGAAGCICDKLIV